MILAMTPAISTQKTLNPEAEEFKPTSMEKNGVPSLPHQIFHSTSFATQGHELVVYQPQQQNNELVMYQPQPQNTQLVVYQPPPVPSCLSQPCYYYQQNVPLYKAPCYWLPKDFQPHQQQLVSSTEKIAGQDKSFFDKDEKIFGVEMRKNGFRGSFFSHGERFRGPNKRYLLPPRLRRPKGFFLGKTNQVNADTGSYKSLSPIKKDTPVLWSKKTTVMIRNIPNQFRREHFMFFIDHYCSKNHWEYDFLYLPIDFGTDNNMGYAFVNFTSGQAASEISKVLKNFKWHGVKTPTGICSSRKICAVTWARIQGKEQLVKHFSCSNFLCDTDEYLPVVFVPPRNGASSLTKPMPIGKLALVSPVSLSPPLPNDD